MYAAKAIAAFVSLLVTSLVAAPGIVPVEGTFHLVITVIAILAGTITTYVVPNRGTTVVDRVVR
jgi:hypothetical protein